MNKIDSSEIIPCEIPTSKHFINLISQQFGRLFVESFAGFKTWDSGAKYYFYRCRCECGNITVVTSGSIRNGHTKSCGCWMREVSRELGFKMKKHGMLNAPEYIAWENMIQRCTNRKHPQWDNYGGRGVTVCDRWFTFQNFFDDVGHRPSDIHSIDRYPNQNGNYEPTNASWRTKIEQNRNRRNNRMITLNGETHCAAEWAEIMGLPKGYVTIRLHQGWSEHDAVMTPVKQKPNATQPATTP